MHRYFKLGGGLIGAGILCAALAAILAFKPDEWTLVLSAVVDRLALVAVVIGVIAITIGLWEDRHAKPETKPRTGSSGAEVDITKSEAFRQFLRRDPAVKRMPVTDQRRLFAEYRAAGGGKAETGTDS